LFDIDTATEVGEILDSQNMPHIVKFSSTRKSLLYSCSSKHNEFYSIAQHDLETAAVVATFDAHNVRVTSMSVLPPSVNHSVSFVSSCVLGNINFWDLRKANPAQKMVVQRGNLMSKPIVATTSTGPQFAVCHAASVNGKPEIHIDKHDIRKVQLVAETLRLEASSDGPIELTYSQDCKKLLLTLHENIFVLQTSTWIKDAPASNRTLNKISHLPKTLTNKRIVLNQACFDPSGSFVLKAAPNDRRKLFIYPSVETAENKTIWESDNLYSHPEAVDTLAWAPGLETFISTCNQSVVFWQTTWPEKSDDE